MLAEEFLSTVWSLSEIGDYFLLKRDAIEKWLSATLWAWNIVRQCLNEQVL